MKAMILSAGFGTRLKPLTDTLPKALLNYKGVPMINHQIERLINAGAGEIIINAHHHFEKMIEYFSLNRFDVKINLIVEDKILGTGGGILNAEKYLGNENFFAVVNADIETNLDLKKMIDAHQAHNPFATLFVQKRITKRSLEFDEGMKLTGRQNENSVKENLFAFNGVHIISGEIFRKNLEVKFEDIIDIYLDVIKNRNEIVLGFAPEESSFKDLGKIENLNS